LGEIEAVLAAHPGVRQAVVTARRGESDDLRIVAYVVGVSLPHDELRTSLRKKLPEYMLPSAFVFLKALPLTPNGKVDRAALPEPEDVRAAEFVAPRTPVEEKLAGLWAGLLKVKTVGVHDNFFELGGHSLLATQVVSRMRKEFQVEITLVSLFESPTVAAMAEKIEKATADNTARLLLELDQLSDEEAGRLLGLE
jgi:acyl carrier protein